MQQEKATRTRYVFDTGRELAPTPEGQTLGNLLHDFSQNVLHVLDAEGLVIVSGESGLGKTEIFLGRWQKIQAGGLADMLRQQNRTFESIDAQSGGHARSQIDKILQATLDEKPEIVMVDEVGVLFDSEEIKFDAIQQLRADGRKVVLVVGGTGNATQKNRDVQNGLAKYGMKVNNKQLFEFPAYTLNDLQSEQILKIQHPDLSHEVAVQIIEALDRQNIPRIFRVLLYCAKEPEWNTRESTSNFIYHIKIIPK